MQTRFPNVKSDGNMNYKKHSAQIIDESDEIDELQPQQINRIVQSRFEDQTQQLTSLKVIPIALRQNLYICNDELQEHHISSDTILPFNPIQCANATNKDVFEYVNFQWKKEPYRVLMQDKLILEYKKDQLAMQDYFKKCLYTSSTRTQLLNSFFGQNSEKKGKHNLYFEKLYDSKLYTRCAAMSFCFEDYDQSIKALEKINSPLLPIVKQIQQLLKLVNEDRHNNVNNDFHENKCSVNGLQKLKDEDINSIKNIDEIGSVEFRNLLKGELRVRIMRENYENIIRIVRNLQMKDVYLQLIINFIYMNEIDFTSYLLEDKYLNFFDIIFLAYRYFSQEYLQKLYHRKHRLDCIILNKQEAISILEKYLDETHNIAVTGVLAAHLYLLDFPQKDKLAQFYQNYREFLNQNQYFKQRYFIDVEINKVNPKLLEELNYKQQNRTLINLDDFVCQICNSKLSQGYVMKCTKCKHGGHQKHLIDWFKKYKVCPNQKCYCECQLKF
ncbi:hypothetical protein pb186bvf_006492 [Paramecium bursaria]